MIRVLFTIAAMMLALFAVWFSWWVQTPVASESTKSAVQLESMGLERVLVISLPRSKERAQGLVEDGERLGIPLELFNATDGHYNRSFRRQILPLHEPNAQCADIIGSIFNSHERAWVVAAADTLATLVLEDDVRLPSNFMQLWMERKDELPEGYDLAFVGTSASPDRERISLLLSRPRTNKSSGSPLLGFWGYVVTPKGAKALLRLARQARPDNRRLYQPVDLFVAHRVKELQVFVLEPPVELARAFEQNPDRHHVLSTMHQVGIVTLAKHQSTNMPEQDEETLEINRLRDKIVKYGEAGESVRAWKLSRKVLRIMRKYSCWHSEVVLANTGLSLLRVLTKEGTGAPGLAGAADTLLAVTEAFASSIRFTQGTWIERKHRDEFPSWLRHALHQRQQMGLPAVMPPAGWNARIPVEGGGWLHPGSMELFEPDNFVRKV